MALSRPGNEVTKEQRQETDFRQRVGEQAMRRAQGRRMGELVRMVAEGRG